VSTAINQLDLGAIVTYSRPRCSSYNTTAAVDSDWTCFDCQLVSYQSVLLTLSVPLCGDDDDDDDDDDNVPYTVHISSLSSSVMLLFTIRC